MSSRIGRPTNDPKTSIERFRFSDNDRRMLIYCCEKLKKNKSEIMRYLVKELYEKLKEE